MLRSIFRKPLTIKLRPILKQRTRPISTTPPSTSWSPSNFSLALSLITASTLSGYIGYHLSSHSSPSPGSSPQYGTPSDFLHAIKELRDTFTYDSGVRVETSAEVLRVYGSSEVDWYTGAQHLPTVAVSPLTTADVVQIVKIANKYRMPIVVYAGGTSLEGQFRSTSHGGICVDVGGMDKILEIHEEDSDLVCQPGACWVDINETLKDRGLPLFFPLDPAPTATIGGMLSNGCSGTNAVRYGTAKAEWFLNATVVLPNGEVIKTRRRARKSSAGFDLTKLFIGAEGTLGIITEVTIRLAPLLPTTVAVAHFSDVRKATAAVREVLNRGVGIQCIELLDDDFIQALNSSYPTPKYPLRDTLFFKLQGPTPSSLAESASIVKQIIEKPDYGGTGWRLARDGEEAEAMWLDRRAALYTALSTGGGSKGWGTDVCVPVSQLPALVYETKKDIKAAGIKSGIVGHVGDGNFHALLLFKNDEELEVVRELVHRMVERAIALDGTCTGEHGVGIGKKEYLYDELGEGAVELMKTIKRAVDPLNLFNPGKLYPDIKDTKKH
ncbi:hypothetical protein NEOLEDRAFT_1054940 [Neolentinus lepideus HHB14362 ss-1]|uniref:D-lactate dehydrogenase (cytochrome) n=1 Tax=Neolentinus lepideus HHB14362 ss-1 TaxID=1314782 RepID=A0A165VPI8_9AGAM|nr:hypothetical protein NEOLEDRAFT_1054940 [Neolentinus lepideus HHB14362 ss-1]